MTGEALRGFGAKRGFQLQATLAGRPSSKERIGSSGHSPQSPLLGSGSAPRTVPSPPTPELPVSCLRVAESLARNRAASRQALGGWAVEGVHVNPPLTSLRTVTLQPGSTQTRERRLHPPWRLLQLGVPIYPKPTRSCRLSYKIRSTSVPSTPAEAPWGDPERPGRRWNLLFGRRSQRWGGMEGGWTPSRELAHKIMQGPRPWVAGDQLPFSKAP